MRPDVGHEHGTGIDGRHTIFPTDAGTGGRTAARSTPTCAPEGAVHACKRYSTVLSFILVFWIWSSGWPEPGRMEEPSSEKYNKSCLSASLPLCLSGTKTCLIGLYVCISLMASLTRAPRPSVSVPTLRAAQAEQSFRKSRAARASSYSCTYMHNCTCTYICERGS